MNSKRFLFLRSNQSVKWINPVPSMLFLLLIVFSFLAVDTNQLAVIGLAFSFCFFLNMIFFGRKNIFTLLYSNKRKYFDVIMILVFMFYVLMSILWSESGRGILIYKEIVRVAISVFLLLFFMSFLRADIGFDYLLRITLIVTLTVIGTYLVIHPIKAIILNPNQGTYYWDVQLAILKPGILYHQATVGWVYGLSFFLSLSLLPGSRNFEKLFLYFSCVIALMMIIFSHSRGAYLGVVLGLICYFFSLDYRKFYYLILFLFLLIVCILSVYFLADVEAVDKLIDRADSGRWQIWQGAISKIVDKPFFGYGYASASINDNVSFVAMHYHSLYIGTLVYGGIVGLLIFLLLVVSAIVLNYGVEKNRGWYSILVMALVVFLFDGNHVLTYPSAELYIFLLPLLSMALNRLYIDQENTSSRTSMDHRF